MKRAMAGDSAAETSAVQSALYKVTQSVHQKHQHLRILAAVTYSACPRPSSLIVAKQSNCKFVTAFAVCLQYAPPASLFIQQCCQPLAKRALGVSTDSIRAYVNVKQGFDQGGRMNCASLRLQSSRRPQAGLDMT